MGVNLLFKIAAVLKVSPNELALEWMKKRDEHAEELIALFSGMNAEQKKEMLRFAHFTLSEMINL